MNEDMVAWQWLQTYLDQGWYESWEEIDELLCDDDIVMNGYFVW